MLKSTRNGNAERILLQYSHLVGFAVDRLEEIRDPQSLLYLLHRLTELTVALRFYVEIVGSYPTASVLDQGRKRTDGRKASDFYLAAKAASDARSRTRGQDAAAIVRAYRRVLPCHRPGSDADADNTPKLEIKKQTRAVEQGLTQ